MPKDPRSKKFFTIAEFSQLTGDSQSTIRRQIRAGDLPYIQSAPRKKIKIPCEALILESSLAAKGKANQQLLPIETNSNQETISGPTPDWLG